MCLMERSSTSVESAEKCWTPLSTIKSIWIFIKAYIDTGVQSARRVFLSKSACMTTWDAILGSASPVRYVGTNLSQGEVSWIIRRCSTICSRPSNLNRWCQWSVWKFHKRAYIWLNCTQIRNLRNLLLLKPLLMSRHWMYPGTSNLSKYLVDLILFYSGIKAIFPSREDLYAYIVTQDKHMLDTKAQAFLSESYRTTDKSQGGTMHWRVGFSRPAVTRVPISHQKVTTDFGSINLISADTEGTTMAMDHICALSCSKCSGDNEYWLDTWAKGIRRYITPAIQKDHHLMWYRKRIYAAHMVTAASAKMLLQWRDIGDC